MNLISRYAPIPSAVLPQLDGTFVDFEFCQSRVDHDPSLFYMEVRACAMSEDGTTHELGRLSGWRHARPFDAAIDEAACQAIDEAFLHLTLEAGAIAEDFSERRAEIGASARLRGHDHFDGVLVIEAMRIRPEFRRHRIALAMLRELRNMLPRQSHIVMMQGLPFYSEFSHLPQSAHAGYIERARRGLSRYYTSDADLGFEAIDSAVVPGLHHAFWALCEPHEREVIHLELGLGSEYSMQVSHGEAPRQLRRIIGGSTTPCVETGSRPRSHLRVVV